MLSIVSSSKTIIVLFCVGFDLYAIALFDVNACVCVCVRSMSERGDEINDQLPN